MFRSRRIRNRGSHALISLKKFLDAETPSAAEPAAKAERPCSAVTECYRAALRAMGKSAVQSCPVPGAELEKNLNSLEYRISIDPSEGSVKWAQKQLEVQLDEWGTRTAEYLRAKADGVREVLIALARTAETVGSQSQGQTSDFRDITVRLESIADLDDLSEIRTTLLRRVNELKSSVDRMARDNEQMVSQLQAEVNRYETRLREVEHLVLKDGLTGVANRRSVEERIRCQVASGQTFCVIMLDLNGFKLINDRHGHPAGDDLLRHFAGELQTITRAGDLVGRWGGDEFVVLLSCDFAGATLHANRIREWVFGKYSLQSQGRVKPLEVAVDAAIGLAEWHPGQTLEQVIAAADAAMYQDKNQLAKV